MTEPPALLASGRGSRRVSRRALGRLLSPRSVVVVGASDDPTSIGGAPLALLERFGYQGEIHLVSRSRNEVKGKKCLPSIAALPEGVDAAILAIPQVAARQALEQLGGKDLGGAIVFSSGFAETGADGAAEEQALSDVALRHDIALAGPNCLGLVNFTRSTPLTFGHIAPNRRSTGRGVAVVAQSGAMSLALTYALMSQDVTVTHMISTGNEAVLAIEDYLDALLKEPAPMAIVLLAEHIRHPGEFLEAAARARAMGTALCLMHTGLSDRSREASLTHTGALSGDQQALRAVLAREGVLIIDSLDEIVSTAALLASGKLPKTGNVGLMTDSGALKCFAIDFASRIGLALPALNGSSLHKLARELPDFATPDNPVDITAMGLNAPDLYARVASVLLEAEEIGTLVVAAMPGSPAQNGQQVEALLPVLGAAPKPVVYAIMGGQWEIPEANRARIAEAGVPLLRSPELALRAVSNVISYASALRRLASAPGRRATPVSMVRARAVPGEDQAKALLSAAGLRVPRGRLATSLGQARQVASEVGYPVILKVASPEIAHKSDVGGVLRAASESELEHHYQMIRARVAEARPDALIRGILVEEAVNGGTEMLIGARRDPNWGPFTLIGFGGTLAEVVRDVAVVPGDADRNEILSAVKSLRCAPVLDGARGQPPRDTAALLEVVETIAALLRESPEVQEIEVNPLLVLAEGGGAIVLDAVIR